MKRGAPAKRDACLATGESRFARSYAKAHRRARRRNAACGLTQPVAAAADTISGPGAPVSDAVLEGWSAGRDPDDDGLRSALLRQTGMLCGALLRVEEAQARRRNVARGASARARARARFESGVARTLAKAARHDVAYAGASATDIARAIDGLVGGARSATAGVEP